MDCRDHARMSRAALDARMQKRLLCQQTLHDPALEPRNALRWLPELRRWQAERLRASFARFLADAKRRPAAEFFLSDIYGDHDFTQRDADIARVLPMMRRLLPEALLEAVVDGIELSALSHAFDLRMAEVLHTIAPKKRTLDAELYARAYRLAGKPRLRGRQLDLIERVGTGLVDALRIPGLLMLLKMSRGPARAAGLEQLQNFLERGFSAFGRMRDAQGFIDEIVADERAVRERLFNHQADPFLGAMD